MQKERTKMPSQVKPIPQGYHTVTPYLAVQGAAEAIAFYQRAFGAKEIVRMDGPAGKIAHAEIKIGDSMVMLGDEMPSGGCRSPQSLGGSTVNIFLYVEDVDSVFNQAVSAGGKVEMPVTDMFWGDRFGKLTDPFGHSWSLATHKEDVAPEEMGKRAQAAMAKMAQQAHSAS
jgi:PhnB protein